MATLLEPAERATQPSTNVVPVDDCALRARIDALLSRHPAVGLALGVIRNGRLDFFDPRGVRDVASQAPIDEDTVFRVASISKTFTAIAVMQLWEKGLIDLDAPVNGYLRTFQLVAKNAAWQAATVRHLLTHTGGIPETVHPSRLLGYGYGESFSLDAAVPSLSEYYRGGIRLEAEPGTRFTYTDHNFSVLGQVVEDVSGQPIAGYLREHVFEPLGMGHTSLVRADHETHLAMGYNLGAQGPKAVTDRQWLTAAASMVSTATPPAAMQWSDTRASCRASTHRSWSPPRSTSASWPSPTEPAWRCCGCRPK